MEAIKGASNTEIMLSGVFFLVIDGMKMMQKQNIFVVWSFLQSCIDRRGREEKTRKIANQFPGYYISLHRSQKKENK